MKWLEQRQKERRLWTASATTALMGLILGVVGVLPAIASFDEATCSYTVSDGYVQVSWSNVPDDMPLEIVAKLDGGETVGVSTNAPGNIVGYGPQGSWSGLHYPGARTYWMVGLSTDENEGGYTPCAGSVPGPTPTSEPEPEPTEGETPEPEETPTAETPSETPAETPTVAEEPTEEPTAEPTEDPTEPPLSEPSATEPPAEEPTEEPTEEPEASVTPSPTPEATPTPSPPWIKAKVYVFCEELSLKVKLHNHGGSAGPAYVDIDGVVYAYEVPAGGWDIHIENITEGQTVRVVVHTGNVSLLDETFTDTCKTPEPELAAKILQECDAGKIKVIITNSGDASGEALVEVSGQQERVTVEPGEEAVVRFNVDPNVSHQVTVTGNPDSDPIVLATETKDPCVTPEPIIGATASVDCATDVVTVAIVNSGTATGTADYDIAGTTGSVTLEPGETENIAVPLPEGADPTVTVRLGDDVVFEETPEVDCGPEGPLVTATIFQDCANGELVVTVTNAGPEGTFATITIDGDSQEVGIGPDETATITRPLRADGLFDAEVRVGDEIIVSESGALDCETSPPPSDMNVTFDIACSHGEVRIDVTNDGAAPETVTVIMNGTSEQVIVDPGTTHRSHLQLSEDQRYDVSVLGPTGNVIGSASGTFDCVQVLSDPPERKKPMELPKTGVESFTLAMAGTVLMLAGGLAVVASNSRKRRLGEI